MQVRMMCYTQAPRPHLLAPTQDTLTQATNMNIPSACLPPLINQHQQAYQLGPASLEFSINITIDVPVNNSGTGSSGTGSSSSGLETVQLSPSIPLILSTNKLVQAQLLGDLASYTQLPVLR